jgi:hypothetical protein
MSKLIKCVCLIAIISTQVRGQQTNIQPASHLAATSIGQLVKFSQQPTAIGECLSQRVGMELNIHTVIKQSGQVAHDGNTALRRRQERQIEVLEVTEGRARQARVSYQLSRSLSPENENPTDEFAQPVEGKAYLVSRSNDRLIVTELDGAIPPRQEYDVVVESMESFGLSNPLGEYLLSQDIHVGDRLQVPNHLASKMMGFDSLGEVQKFELQLTELKNFEGRECAVFVADIAALGKPENPLHVQAQGKVVIEIDTCRTLEATLQGPISFLSSEQQTEFSATGEVLLAIRSQYSTKN